MNESNYYNHYGELMMTMGDDFHYRFLDKKIFIRFLRGAEKVFLNLDILINYINSN